MAAERAPPSGVDQRVQAPSVAVFVLGLVNAAVVLDVI